MSGFPKTVAAPVLESMLGEAKSQQSAVIAATTYVDLYDLAVDYVATSRPVMARFNWSAMLSSIVSQRLFVAFMLDGSQLYERTQFVSVVTDTSGGTMESGAIWAPPGLHTIKLQAKVAIAAGQNLTILGGNLPLYEYSLVVEGL